MVGRVAAERAPRVLERRAGEEGGPALAAFPLSVGDELLGVLALTSAERLPGDAVATLSLVADAIAHGIERLRAEARLEEQAAELKRSNADLEQFAYVASHDLQEPLRMISGFGQLLARKYQGKLDADADRYIGHVVGGVARMQRVINDLLAYSRIDRKGAPMKLFSLEAALAAALADLAPALAEAGGAVTHDPLPVAFGSEDLVVQLLSNLIGNALKFCGARSPKIHVSATRAEAPEARRRTVLVVEDNVDAREALEHLLEFWGHTVVTAPDGETGLHRALSIRPDVMLLDVGLPGMDGYEVARKLRSLPAGQDIYLVAMTGYGSPEDKTRALEAGFHVHLVKPVEPADLSTLLNELWLVRRS